MTNDDASLFAEYSRRIREGSPADQPQSKRARAAVQNHRAIDDRAHQFTDRSYVERLHTLADEVAR